MNEDGMNALKRTGGRGCSRSASRSGRPTRSFAALEARSHEIGSILA